MDHPTPRRSRAPCRSRYGNLVRGIDRQPIINIKAFPAGFVQAPTHALLALLADGDALKTRNGACGTKSNLLIAVVTVDG
jgi:hypothetical protein